MKRKKLLVPAAALALCCAMATGAYAEKPDTSGGYHPSMANARRDISTKDFTKPDVRVNRKNNAITNVYDAKGNLIPATLSSDKHFYIVPTNEGYLYIPTGF